MDYFFMNECIFKKLIQEQKYFILEFLASIDIKISDYNLFELDVKSKNNKIDILLFCDETIINIEFNKNEKSLIRNRIYIECLSKILPTYKFIQININLFKKENTLNKNIKIYNYYDENEYIRFLTSKKYKEFKTKNKNILNVLKYIEKIDHSLVEKEIINENKIKEKLDNLIKD